MIITIWVTAKTSYCREPIAVGTVSLETLSNITKYHGAITIYNTKHGGLDGLRGVWLALLILRMVIPPQLTTKQSKIRTHDHALHH
jgi:hypothetical protein